MKSEVKTSAAAAKKTTTKAAEKKTTGEAVKEVAAAAVKVEEKAAKTVAETAKKAAGAAKTTAKKAEKTVKEAEKTVKKAEKTVKEAAAKTVRKAPAKKAVITETVHLQYFGKDINTADLMTAVKAIWTGELGRKEEEIKDITLYLKPEENSAYYVINGEETGRIGL